MCRQTDGWFEIHVPGAGAGFRYRFVIDGKNTVPDPASRFQPEDVDGPSEVVDPSAFPWSDANWHGRPWEEAIIYEIHVGTFTAEGTFLAAMQRIDYLADLGVTAIQLMPIADFNGRWNWGYDGALMFAPDSTYGHPDDLRAFVDAAHQRGIMVFLDVVYNHFGPKGNHLNDYSPIASPTHKTMWGPGLNFDGDGSATIRDLIISNARYWIAEFHVDGLRFDAVDTISDNRPHHILAELVETVRADAIAAERQVHLIAENPRNQTGWLRRAEDGTPRHFTAQWNDDLHHLLHTALTGESFRYYEDYVDRPDLLGRALAENLAYQGEVRPTVGEAWGEPSQFLPPTAFVSFLQNHDHVGNRPHGERIGELAPVAAVRAAAALYLLSPQIPMIFMGEEWGAKQRFPFFSDIGDDLADSIRKGREDQAADSPTRIAEPLPDPMAEETFQASKIDWSDRLSADGADMLGHYERLIRTRRQVVVPLLPRIGGDAGELERIGRAGIRVRWRMNDGSIYCLVANLSPDPIVGVTVEGSPVWLEGKLDSQGLGAWSLVFSLISAQTHG
jgi:maltooligosyltrehalose trehalohydrolase